MAEGACSVARGAVSARAVPTPLPREPDPQAAETMVLRRAGAMQWRIRAELIEDLFDGPRLRLPEYERDHRAQIVKQGPHRAVHRLALASGVYYLKHYRVTNWTDLLANLFRPTKARREGIAAERAARLGVRTYRIEGVGQVRAAGLVRDSFLLTREIGNAIGLDEFVTDRLARFPESRQTALRQQVARLAGELTARLHQGGFLHRDYHSENLLIQLAPERPGADERGHLRPVGPTMWLIDLHPVDFVPRPSARRLEGNLALLASFLWQYTRPVDRLRFARSWWETFQRRERQNPGEARLPYASFREFVERASRTCYHRMLRACDTIDRRWERGNRRLMIADGNTASGRVACRGVAELGREWIETMRDAPERLLADGRLTPDESSRSVTIEFAGFPCECECRRFHSAAARGFARIVRPWTPARRAWEMSHALRCRGIGAPRPLWFMSQPEGAHVSEYLLTERIIGAAPLARELERAGSAQRSGRIGRILADRLRLMFDARFVHRELTTDTILVRGTDNAEGGHSAVGLWFDRAESVHRGSRIPWLFRRQFERMLARLEADLRARAAVTKSMRLRVLRRLLGREFRGEWKRLWRRVAREAAQFEAQQNGGADRATH